MSPVSFYDLLGVSDLAGAIAAWPVGFVQATIGWNAQTDPGPDPDLNALVTQLQTLLTFQSVHPGATADRVGLSAELRVGLVSPGIFLTSMPDVEFRLLASGGAPARVYVTRGDTGVELVVEALAVEIRLPRRLIMPMPPAPGDPIPDEVVVLAGFVPGQHDTLGITLRRDQPSSIFVHVRVRMTEEREFVIEPAVPISVGPALFLALPCRALHDLQLWPTPHLAAPHPGDELAQDWARHSLESPLTTASLVPAVLSVRTIDVDDTRAPFDALAAHANGDRDEPHHIELVLEDVALPFNSPGVPIPLHFTIGLRRRLEPGDDPAGVFDLAGLPLHVKLTGLSRILSDYLVIEQLLVRSVPWSRIGDGTPESQFIFLKAALANDPGGAGASTTIEISDEWTVLLGRRHTPPGVHLFTLFGASVSLLGWRGGLSVQRLIRAHDSLEDFGDALVLVGDLEIVLDGGSHPADPVVKLQSSSKKPKTVAIEGFGWQLGAPTIGKFFDPNGAEFTAADSIRLHIDEFGFTTEPNGATYVTLSGSIPIPFGDADAGTPVTDAASTNTDPKQQNGVGVRFYRLRWKVLGPDEASQLLVDGIGLSLRFTGWGLSGFGVIADYQLAGTRFSEFGFGAELRVGVGTAEFKLGGTLFYGHATGGGVDFKYLLAGLEVSPVPLGCVEFRDVRAIVAVDLAPDLGPLGAGAAQPMRLYEWYKAHGNALVLPQSRDLRSAGWIPTDGAWALGGGFSVSFGGQRAVTLDAFAMYRKSPADGSGLLVALALYMFHCARPLAYGAFELDGDRWSLLIGLSIGTDNLIGHRVPLLSDAPFLTGNFYASNKPGVVCIGQLEDPSTWLAMHFGGDLWLFKFQLFSGLCLQLVDLPEGPRAFGLRCALSGGSRFFHVGGIDFYLTLEILAGVWRTESKVSGFQCWIEGGFNIDVFWVFDFGASARVEWDYLGPDPAYNRLGVVLEIHTPWWLPDVTWRFSKVLSSPQPARMRALATPLVSASAHPLATRQAFAQPVTPVLGGALDEAAVYHMAELSSAPPPVFPPGALDVALVAVDSVIAMTFKPAVDDQIVWGHNTPDGVSTQASNDLAARYQLVEIGIRRRPRFGGGAWTVLLDPAASRIDALPPVPPGDLPARFAGPVNLMWNADFQRERRLEPRQLLLNAATPYLHALVHLEGDENLVQTQPGWPCCGAAETRAPAWHSLDFAAVALGVRAPVEQAFTQSHSLLHWIGPPPVVGPGVFAPPDQHVARIDGAHLPAAAFARIAFDTPARSVEITALWKAMHVPRSLVISPFRGLVALPEVSLKLSSTSPPPPIAITDDKGITHLVLRIDGTPVALRGAAAQNLDLGWVDLVRIRYQSAAEWLGWLVHHQKCGARRDDASDPGRRFAWLPDHDYEVSIRTRVALAHAASGELSHEVPQQLVFRTKGLPGANAVDRTGEELEPYVESRYPAPRQLLYRGEPAALAFNERFDIFTGLAHAPSASDPDERRQQVDFVLAVERVGGSGEPMRVSQTAVDWIVAHRGTTLPPDHGAVVIGADPAHPVVRALARTAATRDPARIRWETLLASPNSCALTPPSHPSRVLTHDPVDPTAPTGAPPRWAPRAGYRANLRVAGGPFVERAPFVAGDETALSYTTEAGGSIALWSVAGGALVAPAPPGSRALATFGEPTWLCAQLRATIDPQGGAAGLAVAVGTGRAITALVDEPARRLRLIARSGSTVTEQFAALPAGAQAPYQLELLAFDDEIRASVAGATARLLRGELRAGRAALVAGSAARFADLRVEALDAYRFEFDASRYADFAEHIASFAGPAPAVVASPGAGGASLAALLADPRLADATRPGADPLLRQRLFDDWIAALALPLRRQVDRLEISRRETAGATTDLLVIESPEPLPFGDDITATLSRVGTPPSPVPFVVLCDGDQTRALIVPTVTATSHTPQPLAPGAFQLALTLDRVRWRAGAPDATTNLRATATVALAW